MFYLKHGDKQSVLDRKHIYILIADYILLLLEDESELFDRSGERPKFMPGPNVALQRLTKQYVKLERTYLNQNKDYDPYSNTMHPHQLLNNHYFEINMQAKEERVKTEIQELSDKYTRQSGRLYKIPQNTNNVIYELSELATGDLVDWTARNRVQIGVKTKVEEFIRTLFNS